MISNSPHPWLLCLTMATVYPFTSAEAQDYGTESPEDFSSPNASGDVNSTAAAANAARDPSADDDVFAEVAEGGNDPTTEEFFDEPFGYEEETADRIFDTRFYGYIDSYWEKVANTPAGVNGAGDTVFESNPHEFDVLNLHVMVQGTILNRFRYFVNLAGPGSGGSTSDTAIAIRNAWVEADIVRDAFVVRVGKTYRRFGLYNEILDATPTFIGIEPPELFDNDHLMLTRTTNLMIHGAIPFGENVFSYSLATGNDERSSDQVPLGLDVHLDFGTTFRVGSSFYSSNGDAAPSRSVGQGSPGGGVVNWMRNDEFLVFGGYLQVTWDAFIFQAAYWQAVHNATRDPDQVALLPTTCGAGMDCLNARQLERFFNAGVPDTDGDYSVRTFYVRTGYEFDLGGPGTLTPYGQFDYYSNPETVASKSAGGDNEAGLADNGEFFKLTAGAIYRPIPAVALKVDGSAHIQQFNNSTVIYPEIRVSLSYLWELEF